MTKKNAWLLIPALVSKANLTKFPLHILPAECIRLQFRLRESARPT